MGAHTGNRRCNASTSTARRRKRSPASTAAMAARRPLPPPKPMSKDDAAEAGKARTKAACSRRRDMEVRKKMDVLRRLVPSGSGSGSDDGEVDELLLRAAGYIARLQAQVTVMQFMVDVLEDAKH